MARLGVTSSFRYLLLLVLVSVVVVPTSAFVLPGVVQRARTTKNHAHAYARHALHMSTLTPGPEFQKSYVLSDEEVNPILRLEVGGKEKVVNAFGLWTLVVSLITGPIWAAAMWIVNAVCSMNDDLDPNRALYDSTGKVWSKLWLGMTMSKPTLSGDVDRLKEGHGACLYVANHASWLDIPVLCTVLDPVFKFIAKGELRKVPCIGQQLVGGKHILIDREDRKSQFLTFKEGLGWLKRGVPIMAFPEGQRSEDGRLIDFKGGIFSMAVKSKVPIVPLSVSNTHAVMPGNSLFPVQSGAGKLHVHVHPAIDTTGLSEEEIASAVREALLSKMPEDQHPLPKVPEVKFDVDLDLHHDVPTAHEILKHVDRGTGRQSTSAASETKRAQASL